MGKIFATMVATLMALLRGMLANLLVMAVALANLCWIVFPACIVVVVMCAPRYLKLY